MPEKAIHFVLKHNQQKTPNHAVPKTNLHVLHSTVSLGGCVHSAEAESILRGMRHSGEHVFSSETNQKVNVVLKRWCKEARVNKPVTFHSARHTFCVLLLTNDVPIYTVQQLMCHSDISTTEVYADLLNKTKYKAVRKLPVFS